MKKNKNTFSLILIVALIAVTCVYFYCSFDLSEIADGIANADFGVLAIGFSAVLVYLVCYGLLAKTVMKSFGTRVSLFRGFLYACTDFYYCAITPSASGGQPLVIYNMVKDGIPASQASFFTFFHTAVYKTVLIVFNVVAVLFCFEEFRQSSRTFEILWFVGIVINIGIIFLCLLSMFKRGLTMKMAAWIFRVCGKLHIIKNADERLAAFSSSHDDYRASAVLVIKNWQLTLKLFLIVFVQRGAFFSIAYIVYRGMGLSAHGYLYFLCLQAMIAMAVDSLPLPGGIGVNEAALVVTLESAYGTPEAAAAATLIIRVINYYFCVFITSIGTLIEQISQKKRQSS